MTGRTTHFRTCNLCEAMCGLTIELDPSAQNGAQIVSIKGDPDDPLSRGHICPKAFALRDIAEDPDRLRTPIRRTGDRWEPIGWDAAFDEVAQRLQNVQRQHGRDAVAVYQGNPSVHHLGTMLTAPTFVRSLRTKNRFSATSVDQLPHHFAAYFLYGHQLLLPVPDIDRTQHFLLLGGNPLVSNGSMMTAPGMRQRLTDLQKRGGEFVLVDPRRTESAQRADRHHFIVPGTDGLLLAALIHRVFTSGAVRKGRVAGYVDGLDRLEALFTADFSADAVADTVGIAADEIRGIADAFAAAPSAVCHGRMGVSTAEFGAVNIWLATVLNIITGNFDRVGGLMFPSPAVDITESTGPGGFGRWKSRVRGLPEFGGELPVATLSEEIETPGDGQIRALVTSAGNPVLSTPNGKRLDAALSGLDFMVSIDPWLNETTRHAHIILPPKTGLEVPHYDLIFAALAVRNIAKFDDPLLPGHPDGKLDAEIFTALTKRLSGRQKLGLAPLLQRAQRTLTATQQLDVALRFGPRGVWRGRLLREDGLSVAALRDAPHGVDLGPLQPQLPERLRTADRRINLVPDVLVGDLPRLAASVVVRPETPKSWDLRLIGRRGLADNNSWLHNAPSAVKGRNRCTLFMHPDDAAHRGLSDGEDVTLRSHIGEVVAPLQINDAMMPGVVCLPHGYGHGRDGTRLHVANAHAGVSVNDITDPDRLDALSGNAAFSGQPVMVVSAFPDPQAAL